MNSDHSHRPGDWFEAHAARLALYARQWLTRAEAEDVVQGVFLRLMSQRIEPAKVEAWLFTAVRHAAISEHRSRRRRDRREREVAGEKPDWFDRHPGDLIDAAAAEEALRSLPPEQREVIVLRIWGGLTLSETAQVMSEPVSTLFSRYRAGLAAIRQIMESSCKTKTK